MIPPHITVNCPTSLLISQLEAENRLNHGYAVHQVADPIIKSTCLKAICPQSASHQSYSHKSHLKLSW